MAKKTDTERAEAIATLRALLKPGSTVHTILRHCSKSGMSRVIDLVVVDQYETIELPKLPDGSTDWGAKGRKVKGAHYPRNIGWLAAKAMGDTYDRNREGIKISGAGMDMGFALVYNLGRTLYPEGFAPSEIGIRPLDGKRVNVNIGRGRNAGPMRKEEMAELAAKGWTFPGGRNGDATGWDNDGGYALNQRWL